MLTLFVTLLMLPLAVGVFLDWLRAGRHQRRATGTTLTTLTTSAPPVPSSSSAPPSSRPSRPAVATAEQAPVSSGTLNQKCA